jgi:hypothetical protein
MATNEPQAREDTSLQLQAEHRWLQKLAGEWEHRSEVPAEPGDPSEVYTGTETVRSLGGRWFLLEETTEQPDGETHTALMTLGFDPDKGHFVGTWVSSGMTQMWVYDRGDLDTDERALTLHSWGPNRDGTGETQFRDVIEFESDDRRALTGYMLEEDGRWTQLMRTEYRRVG